MSTPIYMSVYGLPDNVRYSLVKGMLRDWLKTEGVRAQYSATNRGWYVRTEHLGDVIARAEQAGIRVRMRGPVE